MRRNREGCAPSRADLRRLQVIPGVGPAMARDLWKLGVTKVEDLTNRDPEELYRRLIDLEGAHVDRCVLYVFRCAVYYASESVHDPELLKWWAWKDNGPAGM